jgi:hypothetical protein
VHSPRNPFSNAKQVSVARRSDGAQDLLVRGTDGAAWLLGLDANGAVVQPWRSLGGQVLGAPSASWSGDGSHLDVYAVGTDRQMYHDRYDLGQEWFSGWGLVPGNGQAGSGTVEVARNPRDDSMDLLVRGTDSVPYDLRLDAGSQLIRGWVSLGGVVMGAPSGTWSSSGYRLDVYAVGSDWQMYHDSYDTLEPSFNGWGLVGGGGQAGSPTVEAARRWDDGVDLLVKGTDNAGYDLQLDSVGSVVRGWVSLGGIVQGAPTGAYVPSSMHLDVYAVGSDAQMYHDSSDNGLPIGWGTSLPGGFSGWSLVPGAGSAG